MQAARVLKYAVITGLLGYLAKKLLDRLRAKEPDPPENPQPAPSEVESREMTLDQLHQCDGKDGNPMYVSIRGLIYDVSSNPDGLYEQGSDYHNFLGHDCTYAFAHNSLNFEEDLDRGASKLGLWEREALAGWICKYEEQRYPKVGLLKDAPWKADAAEAPAAAPTPDPAIRRRVGVLANQQGTPAEASPTEAGQSRAIEEWEMEYENVELTESVLAVPGVKSTSEEPAVESTSEEPAVESTSPRSPSDEPVLVNSHESHDSS
jgi:membrane-associated progesterone receptor component